MLTIFFASRKLLVLEPLPKGQKYNQDYYVQEVTPELQSERSRFARRNTLVEFPVHMDNSICHNGTKVTTALNNVNVIRPSYLADSPDLTPYDFWLFGMLKHRMTDRQLPSQKETLDEAAFEEL
jgi:hypothetical protein